MEANKVQPVQTKTQLQSLTIKAVIVAVVLTLLEKIGVSAEALADGHEQVGSIVDTGLLLVSLVVAYIGRLRATSVITKSTGTPVWVAVLCLGSILVGLSGCSGVRPTDGQAAIMRALNAEIQAGNEGCQGGDPNSCIQVMQDTLSFFEFMKQVQMNPDWALDRDQSIEDAKAMLRRTRETDRLAGRAETMARRVESFTAAGEKREPR